MDNFVHLHTHSTYSFTDGFGLPEQYVARAKELGQPALGVTDHGNISAHYKWYKQSNKAGIKPILGCEMYIVEKNTDIRERNYNHITVLAKNNIGYKNLLKLVTKSWTEQFYYKPRITFQDLFDNQEGLIVLSGCLSSPVMEQLKEGRTDKAVELLRLFKSKLDDFYVEIQPIGFKAGIGPYKTLVHLFESNLRKEGFKWVATSDCHYVHAHQNKIQEVLLCVQSRDTMNNPERWKFDQDDFFLKSRQEMEDSLKKYFPETDFTDALDNTVKIADMVDFTFPTASPIKFPMPDEEKFDFLKNLCMEGLKRIGKSDDIAYYDRMMYEIDLIQKKNFIDYFLVVWDLVNFAKKKDILVGPARGSAAGSLACYLLRITEVNPLEYDLLFERFIDINREDMPDIDIDFEDVRRHEVKEYLSDKYGSDKVGNLPVFMVFKGKSALKDIGRTFSIPFKVIDEIKDVVLERSGGDSRASFTLQDTFDSEVFTKPKEHMKTYPELKYAIEIEGQIRQMGTHASGFIVSNEPITNFCAIYKVKDEFVISLDYKDASDIGLLKIDLLGISTLSVISKTMRKIKERTGKDIDIYNLPLDDKKTYGGFLKEKLFGIFQFDGQAVNQVCRQIKPRDFESLSAISALARPGPLNGGSTTAYIQRRAGKEKIEYAHKVMESYTKETYGIVVYQEQVMKTMREVGKMSWKDTADIRKLISRSQGVEKFNTFKDKFAIGARDNGMNEQQIDTIWEAICTFGSWAFNKSHSVSYTIISYWTMWLKIHYPIEFYAAVLALTDDNGKRKKIIKEYKREGYKVLPVSINNSKEEFSIETEGLRVGFEDITGIGPGAATKLRKNQPYKSYGEFDAKMQGKHVTEKVRKYLINLGAFDEIEEASKVATLFNEMQTEFTKEPMAFELRNIICPWDMDYGIERNWLPVIKKYDKYFKTLPLPIEELKNLKGGFNAEESVIYGIVYDKNLRDVREVSRSKGKNVDVSKYKGMFQFANFILEDDTDFITCRLSHLKFPEYGNLIFEQTKPDDVLIIKGKMGSGIRMFFVNKVVNLRLFKEEQELKLQSGDFSQ